MRRGKAGGVWRRERWETRRRRLRICVKSPLLRLSRAERAETGLAGMCGGRRESWLSRGSQQRSQVEPGVGAGRSVYPLERAGREREGSDPEFLIPLLGVRETFKVSCAA